jgi:hypothetical protein
MWALLDYEGNPVRFFTYPAKNTVEIKEPKWVLDWDNYEECLL